VRTISMTVRLLPGIESVEADFKTRAARIRFDPRLISLEIIQQSLTDIGYDVQPQTEP